MEQQRKSLAQTNLKGLVDQIIDKNNWKQRWGKIRTFIESNRAALAQQLSGGGKLEAYLADEKNQVFTVILALYAGEDVKEVFDDLNALYKKYPQEVEFYIP